LREDSSTGTAPTGTALAGAASAVAPARTVPSKARLDSVQLLRAVAATTVVAFHTEAYKGIGSWGVTLFFVISGFIMCYVTEASGAQFLEKRIIRIVPLYWAGTIAVFGVAVFAPSLVQNTTTDVGSLFKSLAFIPFYKGSVMEPVLFLGWTLNLEMMFYVLFAVSLAVSHRHRAAIASAALLLFAGWGQLVHFPSDILTFLSQPIILDFIFGMAAYSILRRLGEWTAGTAGVPARRWAWLVVGVAVLATMPFVAHVPVDVLPATPGGIVLGLIAAAAFCCIVHGLTGVRLPLFAVLVGDASYSLYLFHPYVIQAFAKVFKAFDNPGIVGYVFAALAVALCCVLAVALYRFVEAPVTRYLRSRLAPGA
jgi:exopolysaccharide production protein ExoZ